MITDKIYTKFLFNFDTKPYHQTQALIPIYAKLCALDGKPNEQETNYFNYIFLVKKPNTEDEILWNIKIWEIFLTHNESSKDLYNYIKEFSRLCFINRNVEEAHVYLRDLCFFALQHNDRKISEKKYKALKYFAKKLNFSNYAFNNFLATFTDLYNQRDTDLKAYEEIIMQKYYQTLGCNINDSYKVVKKAYRRLCQKYHPDKIQTKNKSKNSIEEASIKIKEINEAFDKIKQFNNWS